MLQRLHHAFESNRAVGRVALTLARDGERTKRERVHESGSLRVRFPNNRSGCEAVLVNTAGGMTGGDCFSLDIAVGEGASAVCGTAAAEKIYRSTGAHTLVDVRLSVGADARLAWLPQETILFDAARLARRIDADVRQHARRVRVLVRNERRMCLRRRGQAEQSDSNRFFHQAPHRMGLCTVTSLEPSGNVASTWMS